MQQRDAGEGEDAATDMGADPGSDAGADATVETDNGVGPESDAGPDAGGNADAGDDTDAGWDAGPTDMGPPGPTVPTISSVALRGGSACRAFTCEAEGVSDPQGDPVTLRYTWEVNDEVVAHVTPTLPVGAVMPGQSVRCTLVRRQSPLASTSRSRASAFATSRKAAWLLAAAAMAWVAWITVLGDSLLFSADEESNSVKIGHFLSYLDDLGPLNGLFGQGLASYYYSSGSSALKAFTELTPIDMCRYVGIPLTLLLYAVLFVPMRGAARYARRHGGHTVAMLLFTALSMSNPVMFNSYGLLVVLWYWSSLRSQARRHLKK